MLILTSIVVNVSIDRSEADEKKEAKSFLLMLLTDAVLGDQASPDAVARSSRLMNTGQELRTCGADSTRTSVIVMQ